MPNWKKVILSGSNAVLAEITASRNLSGSGTATASYGLFTGSFGGDGTNLDLSSNTSISTSPFPFAGDGVISGSLLISSSNSTASLTLEGSGSTVFSVQGSQGQLFSLTDDLLHDNLVVNDISGDTIFKVSGSGLVTIPVGDLSGSATATASYGSFSGSFQGDGGGLTNLPQNSPFTSAGISGSWQSQGFISASQRFPFTGDAQITGSLNISGSLGIKGIDGNIIIGSGSGGNITTGQFFSGTNVIVGNNSAETMTDGDKNVFIGENVGSATNAHSNVFIGYEASNYDNSNDNVIIGAAANNDTTARSDQNVIIGSAAAKKSTAAFTGGIAIGQGVLNGGVGGAESIIMGRAAGNYANGNYNIVMGRGTLAANANSVANNIILGYNAANDSTSGPNIAIGVEALTNIAAGQHNTVIGDRVGKKIVGGSGNTAIGYSLNEFNGSGNIIIGSGSAFSTGSIDNTLRIGNGSLTTISASLATGDVIFYNTASAPNFSGSFQGDGTNLNLASNTTIPTSNPFPLTASSAAIISRSIAASDTDSTALRLLGSGSVSQSGIFEVEGSAGPLFSVQDGLDGVLMEVNNISGLPLFQVSSSNEVFINRGNLTSGVNTATASFANFSGSFQGDGTNLNLASNTTIPAGSTPTLAQVVTAGATAAGDVQITGSLLVSSSFVDFSGLTDIKTRRFAITSDHVSGQTVTSASFYDSFVEALDVSVDGDTLHVFSNDSSSVTNDIFEGKNITIVGNGFHFDIVGAGTNNHRWTFTSCSIDVYDFEFRRTPTSNLSNFDTSVWEIKGPSNWHFYNSGFAATKNAHALMIEGDNINIDGVYARLTDSTSYLTYAVYKDTTTNDFTLENFDIHSEAGGIFAQGDRVKIENGNIDYSTTIDRSNAITIAGHTGSISNVNILGNDDNSQNVALKIDPTTGATSKGITFIENVNIRSGEINVANDAHVIIGDCKLFNIQMLSNNVYFAGTGSITNCNIEYDERMGGYTSGGAGIQLHTDQEVRISNCHVFGYQYGLENQYPENIITVYDSYFETGLSYSGNGRGIYGLDTKTATIVGCQGVINISNGQGFGLDLQTTGSGKIHIANSDFINKGPASSYGHCFRLIGSPANNEIYVSDVNIILDTQNNSSGTSAALSISGVTGSYFNNLYVEGYAAGTLNAISSSIVNSTFYQKHLSPGAGTTVWTLNAAGNDNLYSNCTFEVDPEYNASTPDPIVTTYNTQRFHNSTFKGGKKSNFALTGSGDANVELVGNRYINILTGITASNVTDITTGFIDGRGNWEKTQTTSSFDHIEATSFKGDGTNLNLASNTTIPAGSTPTLAQVVTAGATAAGDAQITGSLTVSGSSLNLISGSFRVVSPTKGTMFNIDDNIFTLGPGASAGGGYTAVAIGHNASTGNNYSVSIGSGATTNTNQYAVAIGGLSVSANGLGAVAIGGNTATAGAYGISMGYQAAGSGNYSINLGRSSNGSGANSVTMNTSGDTIAAPSNTRAFNLYLTDGTGEPDLVISASNASKLSGSSFTIENSGSTVFEVIGSEGTLFSVDDDLDGTIFTANDRSGLPVLEASASGEVYIGKAPQSLYTTAVISSNNANVTQSIYGLDTSSYGGAFFEYTAHSGSNARAGNIMAVWNPSDENLDVDISFNETTTLDIGNTENLIMKVHVSQSQAQLAAFSTTAGYNIKTIIKSI